jgi:hypothetical protein
MSSTRRSFLRLTLVSALSVAATVPAPAAVDVVVDAQTLTDLLSTMVPPSAALDLTPENRLTLKIQDLRVTGFDPAGGNGGHILAALRVEVPELGMKLPLQPRLSLHLGEKDGLKLCYLQFERVTLPVPLAGSLDIASLLPRIPVPADQLNAIETARGPFQVRTRLAGTEIRSAAVAFRFDILVSPMPQADVKRPAPSPE